MVIWMNKTEFINALSKEANISIEKATVINSCLEDHFIFGKNNKEKIIADIENKLSISSEEANNLYDIASSLISKGIKNSILHPFKSKD